MFSCSFQARLHFWACLCCPIGRHLAVGPRMFHSTQALLEKPHLAVSDIAATRENIMKQIEALCCNGSMTVKRNMRAIPNSRWHHTALMYGTIEDSERNSRQFSPRTSGVLFCPAMGPFPFHNL